MLLPAESIDLTSFMCKIFDHVREKRIYTHLTMKELINLKLPDSLPFHENHTVLTLLLYDVICSIKNKP